MAARLCNSAKQVRTRRPRPARWRSAAASFVPVDSTGDLDAQPHVRLADRANVGSCAISAATTTLDGGEMPSYGREWRNTGCSVCELKSGSGVAGRRFWPGRSRCDLGRGLEVRCQSQGSFTLAV